MKKYLKWVWTRRLFCGIILVSSGKNTRRNILEKIAVIDLGSNSARLVLVEILPNGHFVVFDELKETVRLGQDMDRDGFLKPSRVAQSIKTLKMFRKLCDSYGVEKVYAFATNAVRRAKNQKSFIEEINSVCGFKFKVLSEEEEAQHIYYGVINSLDISKAVIVDLSGSSLQLICYNRRNILYRENLPFGTITLSELFKDPSVGPEEQIDNIYQYVYTQLSKVEWLKTLEPDYQFIGVGGAFRNLARISRKVRKYPLEMLHNYVVTQENFNAIYGMFRTLDPEKRNKIRGLGAGRADIFPAALACVRSVMELGSFEQLTVSGYGVREGFMFTHAVPGTVEKPISDILGYSAYTTMYFSDVNIRHAEQVCMLSIQLFKQLRVLHKLPRYYMKVLRIASLLHDAGSRIKYYDRYKHAYYFILNSNLCGATHREIVLAAFVAQGVRSDDFNINEWNKYKDVVTSEDLPAVMRLSVILRIAESLDRTMNACVKDINCDVLGDSVIMKTETEGDCTLELKDASEAAAEFARAYRKNLEII